MKKVFLAAMVFAVAAMIGTGAHAFVVDLSNPAHYGVQDKDSVWAGAPTSLALEDNTWAVIALDSRFTVAADSVITFSYRSDAMPEIAGIVFELGQSYSASQDAKNAICLGGVEGWPQAGYQVTPAYQEGSGLVTYTIPLNFLGVGNYFDFLVFINDEDDINGTSGYFCDVSISSATPIPGAVWLLGSGLVGLVGFRRKMKA